MKKKESEKCLLFLRLYCDLYHFSYPSNPTILYQYTSNIERYEMIATRNLTPENQLNLQRNCLIPFFAFIYLSLSSVFLFLFLFFLFCSELMFYNFLFFAHRSLSASCDMLAFVHTQKSKKHPPSLWNQPNKNEQTWNESKK